MVKADKMIHVGMRNKDVMDFEHFAGRQGMEIPQIEKNRLLAVLTFHIDSGIPERVIDQSGAVHSVPLFSTHLFLKVTRVLKAIIFGSKDRNKCPVR
jgi:hypothetical protein